MLLLCLDVFFSFRVRLTKHHFFGISFLFLLLLFVMVCVCFFFFLLFYRMSVRMEDVLFLFYAEHPLGMFALQKLEK